MVKFTEKTFVPYSDIFEGQTMDSNISFVIYWLFACAAAVISWKQWTHSDTREQCLQTTILKKYLFHSSKWVFPKCFLWICWIQSQFFLVKSYSNLQSLPQETKVLPQSQQDIGNKWTPVYLSDLSNLLICRIFFQFKNNSNASVDWNSTQQSK